MKYKNVKKCSHQFVTQEYIQNKNSVSPIGFKITMSVNGNKGTSMQKKTLKNTPQNELNIVTLRIN